MDPLTPADDTTARPWTTRDWAVVAVLCVVAALVFGRAVTFGFVDYDDPLYVRDCLPLRRGLTWDGLKWAGTVNLVGNWHPLTALVELLVAAAFGPRAGPFHAVNLLLHLATVGMLYAFLRRTTGRAWPAAAAAALWGWHPLRVESVAWVSELKDVLCGAMWLGCLLAYAGYARRRTAGRYAAVAGLLALALLAKPMAVTLPLTLLLVDYWPLGRRPGDGPAARWWAWRVAEKVPLLALSAADAVVAVRTQIAANMSVTLRQVTLPARVANGTLSYVRYLADSAVPRHLAVFYPHPLSLAHAPPPGVVPVAAAAALLVAVTAAICLFGRRYRYLPVGWLWFLGTTVPVIGLIQVGVQGWADRYTYVPAIGLTVAVVWLVADLTRRVAVDAAAVRAAVVAAAAAVATVFAVVAASDLQYWRDSATLFAHADAVVPNNYVARAILSGEALAAGRTEDAIRLGREAVDMAIGPAAPYLPLANALVVRGTGTDLADAAALYRKSSGVDPFNPVPLDALGLVYELEAGRLADTGQTTRADDCYRRALACFHKAWEVNPDYVQAGEHLAFALARRGRMDDALAVWRDVVARDPGYAQAQGDYGDALLIVRRPTEAVRAFRAAVAAGGREPRWQVNLAYYLATNPAATPADAAEAVALATAAVTETHEADPDALDKLGMALARTGQYDAACKRAAAARRLAVTAGDPDLVDRIDRRLKLYADGHPFLEGVSPASRPSTSPATTRTTTAP